MRVAVEAADVGVSDDLLHAVDREVTERVALSASLFAGAKDLRLRLRQVKGALLCVVAVGFSGGTLVTSTATSESPLGAIVDALEALPGRIDRMHAVEQRGPSDPKLAQHAAVRAQLERLLRTA